MTLKKEIQQQAESLGFDICGVAPADPLPGAEYLARWVKEGQAGDMEHWLGRDPVSRATPRQLLPEARSIIVVGLNYHQPEPSRRGRIASYALGEDYHDILFDKLKELDQWLQEKGGRQRIAVDSSPLMEKPAAVRAGLGWMAKSTMLLNRKWGTWLFLGEVITTLALEPDTEEKDHCGKCTACIDICPTRAITAPYQLDARRCISYLTIEHKGSIPEEFREAIGDRLFGCEECLTVCPWNRWARSTREPRLQAMTRPDLVEMLGWDDARFRKEFRRTPIFRLKRDRWLRNICVVLGNIGGSDDIPALERAAEDESELVREHAIWAIEKTRQRTGGRDR
jgi:epoxyqueuosine reductase